MKNDCNLKKNSIEGSAKILKEKTIKQITESVCMETI